MHVALPPGAWYARQLRQSNRESEEMSLPSWPGDVPSTARDGWEMPSMFLSPIATEMEGGNQRLRSQPGNNVAVVSKFPDRGTRVVVADYESWQLDPETDGLAILELQRQHSFNGVTPLGAHAALASVYADRIITKILRRW